MLRVSFSSGVSFSSAPDCVDRVSLEPPFFDPHAGPGTRLLLLLLSLFVSMVAFSFLIKACFLKTVFHYTTIFWIFATYRFFPQHLCWGSPFLPPLSVSTVFAGTTLFRPPPQAQGHGCCCSYRRFFFLFNITFSFLIKACFLKADFHYTTIFWIFATCRFFPQHSCWGSPFLPPLTVSTVCAGTTLFRHPPAGPGTRLLL